MPFVTVDPADHDVDAYKLLSGSVVPRPIALVSTVSRDGVYNVAPFSFYNAVCGSPPILMISVGSRLGQLKDTARNIKSSRDFVVNVVDEALADRMNLAATDYPPELSEFDQVGLTVLGSDRTKSPRVAEAPISMECALLRDIEIGNGPNTLFLGQVVVFHVRDDIYEDGKINFNRLRPVGRLAGSGYSYTRELFELVRRPYVPPTTPNNGTTVEK